MTILKPRPLGLAVAGFLFVSVLAAQSPAPKIEFPSASPPALLKQRVGVTDIEINYSRPGLKGRVMIGKVEPYGQVWRTGANTATSISFSTPVKLNGNDIPAGKYALYTIPGETEWTVIIYKVPTEWGAFTYDQKNDLVRFKAKPVTLKESVETFAIEINDVRDDSATINLVWDKTRVPVKLETDLVNSLVSKIDAAMASSDKKPYAAAAGFYFDHDLDLKKALDWTNAAIAERATPTNLHLKAKIQAKMGDKPAAIATARQSTELADKAGGGVKIEYTKLNEALVASLR